MFYSKSTKGFYIVEIHGSDIPDDAVEITTAEHSALLDAQTNGKEITSDAQGRPIAVDRVETVLSYDELRRAEYPPVADYLDGVVKGDQTQIDAYIAACLAVKTKYPKP